MAKPNSADSPLAPEIVKLAEKLAKDPQSLLFIPLAEEFVKAGRLHEAAVVLEEGLKAHPTFLTARIALGRVYHQIGQIEKAKDLLEEAIQMSPENLLAHRTLARIYVEEGALGPAMRSCSVLLADNPKDEEILALKESISQQLHASMPAAREAQTAAEARTPVPHDRELTSGATLQEKDAVATMTSPEHDREGGGVPLPEKDLRAHKVARLRLWLDNIRRRRAS